VLQERALPQVSDDRTVERIAAVESKTKKGSLVKFMAAKVAADAMPVGAPRRWSVPRARFSTFGKCGDGARRCGQGEEEGPG
jgi:hypothetical protein